MNHIVSAVMLPSLVVALVFALSPDNAQSATAAADEQAIRQLEAEWADALVKADFAAIDRITSPDWVITTPDGTVTPKAKADADLKAGVWKFESFKVDDLQIRIHGDTAVVFGLETEKSAYKGSDVSGQYRFTDVFVKSNGTWRCVATHMSKVGAPSL